MASNPMVNKAFEQAPRAEPGRAPDADLLRRVEALAALFRPTPVLPLKTEGVQLYAKLEFQNPIGSVKDRAAYWILRSAIGRGEVTAATTIVESSSGNFAMALASLCRMLGLRFIPVIDPNITPFYESSLRRLCERVVKVEQRDASGGFLGTRLQTIQTLLATEPSAYWTNQYGNQDAVEAHYLLTAGDVCLALEQLDYAFVGVSTGGTIAGVSRRLKEHFPGVRIIGVDSVGSVTFGGAPGPRFIPGIGASVRPALVEQALIDEVVLVPERETAAACRELRDRHGLFAGGSSGTAYAAVQRLLPRLRAQRPPSVLFFCADGGMAYLDTVYDERWSQRL